MKVAAGRGDTSVRSSCLFAWRRAVRQRCAGAIFGFLCKASGQTLTKATQGAFQYPNQSIIAPSISHGSRRRCAGPTRVSPIYDLRRSPTTVHQTMWRSSWCMASTRTKSVAGRSGPMLVISFVGLATALRSTPGAMSMT